LPICTVKTIIDTAAIVIWVNIAGRDYPDIFGSCPRHYPSNISQHSPVVPYTCTALGKKKILLRAYIHQDLLSTRSD
jgi:hypothetical protein